MSLHICHGGKKLCIMWKQTLSSQKIYIFLKGHSIGYANNVETVCCVLEKTTWIFQEMSNVMPNCPYGCVVCSNQNISIIKFVLNKKIIVVKIIFILKIPIYRVSFLLIELHCYTLHNQEKEILYNLKIRHFVFNNCGI